MMRIDSESLTSVDDSFDCLFMRTTGSNTATATIPRANKAIRMGRIAWTRQRLDSIISWLRITSDELSVDIPVIFTLIRCINQEIGEAVM